MTPQNAWAGKLGRTSSEIVGNLPKSSELPKSGRLVLLQTALRFAVQLQLRIETLDYDFLIKLIVLKVQHMRHFMVAPSSWDLERYCYSTKS